MHYHFIRSYFKINSYNSRNRKNGKRLRECEVVVCVKRDKKKIKREKRILFVLRTRVIYIELYKLNKF
jgi:hypothetical protein